MLGSHWMNNAVRDFSRIPRAWSSSITRMELAQRTKAGAFALGAARVGNHRYHRIAACASITATATATTKVSGHAGKGVMKACLAFVFMLLHVLPVKAAGDRAPVAFHDRTCRTP